MSSLSVVEDLSKTMENIDTVAGKWNKKAAKIEPKKEAKHFPELQGLWLNKGDKEA